MNAVFCAMMLMGIAAACAQGRLPQVQAALLNGGTEAVSFGLSMAGAYAFFGGLLGVLRESGAAGGLAALLRRPLLWLFPFAPGEERALDDIAVNLAADMLGMGGAATPAGLKAMRTMADAGRRGGRASDAMLLFLTMNMCSVQILPTTMIALRAQAGAQNPSDVVLPTLLVTGVQMAIAVGACKIMAKRKKRNA